MYCPQPIWLVLGLSTAILTPVIEAGTIRVPADQPTIQAAINVADPGDVVIVAQGEYFENINFNGKAITVRSTDPTDAGVVINTIIDGTGFDHVVQCVSGEGPDTVLSGFVITGGNANGTGLDTVGGGMLNNNSSPTVTNCSFSGNAAFSGGGMYNFFSSPTVTNCSFSGNTATNQGGGMNNTSSSTNLSSPTVTNCSFSGNTAEFGGGMVANNSSPTVSNCSFSGNTADFSGGGMYNQFANPTVTNCTFIGNTASVGGGMINTGSTGSSPTVTNCTFNGNSATNIGGGMHNASTSPTVTNTGFCNNTPDQINGTFTDGGGNSLLYCPPPSPLPPASCLADITGPGGLPEGQVNVTDLLALLASWGACP